jgi:hypothetical protein
MRYYDGCPDSELQALIDAGTFLMKEIRKVEPEAYCTYFPAEGQWQVHKWGKEISGFHGNKLGALQEALTRLQR